MVCRPAHSTVHAARHLDVHLPVTTGVSHRLACPFGSQRSNNDYPAAIWVSEAMEASPTPVPPAPQDPARDPGPLPSSGTSTCIRSGVVILIAQGSAGDLPTASRTMSEPPFTQLMRARIAELSGLDSVHDCRIRLVSIRTRIETNWPTPGGLLRRNPGLDRVTQATIADLLAALPCPLPLEAGGEPMPLITPGEIDLRAAAGRAVDAAMALLVGTSLDDIYPREVTLLESYRPGAPEPIAMAEPTVGLLVATIIGTLEAIVELIGPRPQPSPKAAATALPEELHSAQGPARCPPSVTSTGPTSHS